MIFNFYIEHASGASDFGVCSAESIEDATQYIKDKCGYYDTSDAGFKLPVELNVEYGIEDLINDQYGGVAILSTEVSR